MLVQQSIPTGSFPYTFDLVQPFPHEWPLFWRREGFICILLLFGQFWYQLVTNDALLFISGEMILRPSFPFSTFKSKDNASLFHFCILFCFWKLQFYSFKTVGYSWILSRKIKVFCFLFFSPLCLFTGMSQSWHLQALLSQKAIAVFIALLSSMSSAGSEKTAWSKLVRTPHRNETQWSASQNWLQLK